MVADQRASGTAKDATMRDAFEFYRRGRLMEAERACDAVLAAAPEHFEARQLLGVVHLWNADFERAERELRHARRIDPDSAEANLHYASVLRYLRRFDEALAIYDALIAQRGQFGEPHYGRACVLMDVGRVADAALSYETAAGLLTDHPDVFNDYGIALNRLNRLDNAIAAFDRALAINPASAQALNNRGIALFLAERFGEALASFDRALGIDPAYGEAWYNRGNALLAGQQQNLERGVGTGPSLRVLDDALASFDRALSCGAGFAELFNSRGAALQLMGRIQDARASFAKALDLRADFPEAQQGLAICDAELGRSDAFLRRL